jgi:hypothetical protein
MEKDFLIFEPVTSRSKSKYHTIRPWQYKYIFKFLPKFKNLHPSKHQIIQLLMPISFALTSKVKKNIYFLDEKLFSEIFDFRK